MLERLQKILARAGIASSRRKAEELIAAGLVKVNGKIIKLGDKADAGRDEILVNNQPLAQVKKKVYILLNKPKDYLCAKSDARGRKIVFDLIDIEPALKNTLFTIGRLDLDTEGLLLLTNDGYLGGKLAHPRHRIPRTYIARVSGIISDETLEKIRKGVRIIAEREIKNPKTGRYETKRVSYISRPRRVRLLGRGKADYSILLLKLGLGRNREIRRLCEAVGHPVMELRRIAYSFLTLEGLKVGEWRFLKRDEIEGLEKLAEGKRF